VREYYEGTLADTADSSNTSHVFNSGLGILTVKYRKDPSASGVTMSWESSGDLTTGSWGPQSPVADELVRSEDDVEIRVASFSIPAGSLFVRQRFIVD